MYKTQGVAKYISTRDIYTVEKIKISVRCHNRTIGVYSVLKEQTDFAFFSEIIDLYFSIKFEKRSLLKSYI